MAWTANGVVAEAESNKHMVISREVNLNELYKNRQNRATATINDRRREKDMYLILYHIAYIY